MIKRTVEVSTDGTYLSLRNRQLRVQREGETLGEIPFEDLGVLVIDSQRVTASAAALDAAVEVGATVVICGRNHHPTGMLLPLAGNGLLTERLRHQMDATLPLKKRLWARIVQAKIRNQAENLDPEDPIRKRLLTLAGEVRSGDPKNVEAQAGKLYWSALFADLGPEAFELPFRRKREGKPPNNLLNYGYMVLRAAAARAVSAAGLHPALGLHHSNRNNAFCLADDLMEPYRPWVDDRVRQMAEAGTTEVDQESKKELLSVLTDPVSMRGERSPLLAALQKTAFSLTAAFAKGASNGNDGGKASAAKVAELLDLPAPHEADGGETG